MNDFDRAYMKIEPLKPDELEERWMPIVLRLLATILSVAAVVLTVHHVWEWLG